MHPPFWSSCTAREGRLVHSVCGACELRLRVGTYPLIPLKLTGAHVGLPHVGTYPLLTFEAFQSGGSRGGSGSLHDGAGVRHHLVQAARLRQPPEVAEEDHVVGEGLRGPLLDVPEAGLLRDGHEDDPRPLAEGERRLQRAAHAQGLAVGEDDDDLLHALPAAHGQLLLHGPEGRGRERRRLRPRQPLDAGRHSVGVVGEVAHLPGDFFHPRALD